jgi:hypothetical protein
MIIHRYWTGDAPVPITSAIAALAASQYGQVIDWTDDSLPPGVLLEVDRLSDLCPGDLERHRANIVRLLLLQLIGGIWTDHDFFLLNLPDISRPTVASYPGGVTCSCFMAFRPGDPLLYEALDAVGPADRAPMASGSLMLERVWGNRVAKIELPHSIALNGPPTNTAARNERVWGVHCFSTAAGSYGS